MIYFLTLLYIYKPSLGKGKLPQKYFLRFLLKINSLTTISVLKADN